MLQLRESAKLKKIIIFNETKTERATGKTKQLK